MGLVGWRSRRVTPLTWARLLCSAWPWALLGLSCLQLISLGSFIKRALVEAIVSVDILLFLR